MGKKKNSSGGGSSAGAEDDIDSLVALIGDVGKPSPAPSSASTVASSGSGRKGKAVSKTKPLKESTVDVEEEEAVVIPAAAPVVLKASIDMFEGECLYHKKGVVVPAMNNTEIFNKPVVYASQAAMKAGGFIPGDLVVVSPLSNAEEVLSVAPIIHQSPDCDGNLILLDRFTQKTVEKTGLKVKGLAMSVRKVSRCVVSERVADSLEVVILKPSLHFEWSDELDKYLSYILKDSVLTERYSLKISIGGVKRKCMVQCIRSSSEGLEAGEGGAGISLFTTGPSTAIVVRDNMGNQINKVKIASSSNSKEPSGEIEGPHEGGGDPFADIGGLDAQIKVVLDMITLPLHSPEVFTQYGVQPPRGILLFGPPGTGKTMIARAAAKASKAAIFIVNGPEIISKFVGESEAALRSIFQRAVDAAPSLIFIDEIDSLCPKREESSDEMEKRVVSTLLTNMDGLLGMARVVVIGATNRPNAIDSALRRPGRFDREIEIGIPSAADRYSILCKMLRAVPHNMTEEELRAISGKMHGFVGADVKLLVKEAGLVALRQLTSSPSPADAVGSDLYSSFSLDASHLKKALEAVRPSGLREVTVEVPTVRWTDIGDQALVKQQIKEAVEWPLQHPEVFTRMGIRPPKGIMLYGPPGCSKTLMAKAIATESGMNFIAVKGPELFSKWVGESEQAVAETFRKARMSAPTVVFFDEIDALAVHRGGGGEGGSSGVGDRVLSQLLAELDGIKPLNAVVVVAATNRPDLIDTALLRPGRIDRILYVAPPDHEAREDIFKLHLRKTPTNPEVDLGALASLSEGYSGAEIASICREAALAALEESFDVKTVNMNHFHVALGRVKKMITPEMTHFYDSMQEKYSRGIRK